MAKRSDRRQFIRKLGLSAAVITTAGSAFSADKRSISYLKRIKANNTSEGLNIALIGAGGMGTEDTNTALRHEGIKLKAVCDLYKGRLQSAKQKWGEDLKKKRY